MNFYAILKNNSNLLKRAFLAVCFFLTLPINLASAQSQSLWNNDAIVSHVPTATAYNYEQSVAVSPVSGTVWTAYSHCDSQQQRGTYVQFHDNFDWHELPKVQGCGDVTLKIASDDTLYVLINAQDGGGSIQKWNGLNWVTLGSFDAAHTLHDLIIGPHNLLVSYQRNEGNNLWTKGVAEYSYTTLSPSWTMNDIWSGDQSQNVAIQWSQYGILFAFHASSPDLPAHYHGIALGYLAADKLDFLGYGADISGIHPVVGEIVLKYRYDAVYVAFNYRDETDLYSQVATYTISTGAISQSNPVETVDSSLRGPLFEVDTRNRLFLLAPYCPLVNCDLEQLDYTLYSADDTAGWTNHADVPFDGMCQNVNMTFLNDSLYVGVHLSWAEQPFLYYVRNNRVPPIGWIDAHTHPHADPLTCSAEFPSPQCADFSGLHMSQKRFGRGLNAALSLEHWSIYLAEEIATDTVPDQYKDHISFYTERNEMLIAGAQEDPDVFAFASLECQYDTKYADDPAAWTTACKEDVDYWISRGVKGFKDHMGNEADSGRFISAWNQWNGYCEKPVSGDLVNPECVKQTNVVYPIQTDAWREVIRYIVQDKKLPVLTHATSYPSTSVTGDCFDPDKNAIRNCAEVTRDHLLELGQWAYNTLTPQESRRIVVAHAGMLTDWPDANQIDSYLRKVLDTGISLELSAGTASLWSCNGRDIVARYTDQLIFGTDGPIEGGETMCITNMQEAYYYWLTGPLHQSKSFENACWITNSYGLELHTPTVPQCDEPLTQIGLTQLPVPADAVSKILKDNFLNLYTP